MHRFLDVQAMCVRRKNGRNPSFAVNPEIETNVIYKGKFCFESEFSFIQNY